jgi:outer membrane protein
MLRIWTLASAVALVLVLVLQAEPASAQKLRIGVVDMQRAVSETNEGKAAESRLMGAKKKYETELKRKLKEFNDEEEKLHKAWSILKDDEKRKRAADSRKKFEDLQKQYMSAERTLMEKKTQEMLRITKRVNTMIQKIAQKDKYDYIFTNAAVLWAPRHVDVTNEVIRAFNGQ